MRPMPQGRLVVHDVPVDHAEQGEGQVRAVSRITEQDPRVVPRRPGDTLEPLGHLILRAEVLTRPVPRDHRPIIGALRQRIVEDAQDGEYRLVAKCLEGQAVSSSRVHISHADDLIPNSRAKDALAPRHQEPDGHGLGVPPRLAIGTVHVATEGGPADDHILPVLVKGAQQNRVYVQRDPAIPRQKGIHEGVLLLAQVELLPADRELDPVHILLHFVKVHDAVLKGAPVPADGVDAELYCSRECAPG
mmetsp:Transcript_65212/g.147088  ORF Transcript_65212/g.147088 Transcript_65212/m.147088 type:complete len:247 (+) Transcript_65212:366-1106(+)